MVGLRRFFITFCFVGTFVISVLKLVPFHECVTTVYDALFHARHDGFCDCGVARLLVFLPDAV